MPDINENIYRLRKLNGMSMSHLGKLIGVSKQTIQKYENKEIKNIPYDKVVAIAKVFEITPTELMGWVNTDNADTSINDLEAEIAPFVDMLYKLPTDYRTLALNGIQRVYNMYLNDDTYKGV